MTTETQTREVVRAFHAARTAGDVAVARAHLASSFDFRSPLMSFEDPDAYLTSHIGFQRVVTGLDMVSELYGENEATLIFDLHTATPAGVQRTAEHFRLAEGKISSVLLIFDASPWRPMLTQLGVIHC